jgi:urea transporter
MSWIRFEIITAVVGGVAWLVMWGLDIGGGNFQIGNTDVSVRLVVAVGIGAIASFIISAVFKQKSDSKGNNK